MRLDIKTFLIVVLSVVIAILATCNSCYQKKIGDLEHKYKVTKSEPIEVVKIKVDTIQVIDSIEKKVPVPVAYIPPNYVNVLEMPPFYVGVTDTFYKDVDTASILSDYFATRYYVENIKGEYGSLILEDSISQNRITSRKAKWNLNIPEKTIIKTIAKDKAILYFGLDAYVFDRKLSGAGVSAMFKSKRSLAYEYGAWFDSTGFINHRISIKFPLKLKKQ